jgi:hypothetical protein
MIRAQNGDTQRWHMREEPEPMGRGTGSMDSVKAS